MPVCQLLRIFLLYFCHYLDVRWHQGSGYNFLYVDVKVKDTLLGSHMYRHEYLFDQAIQCNWLLDPINTHFLRVVLPLYFSLRKHIVDMFP